MISAVLPLLMGVVMYFLIGPLGAIFMLLSPVLLIGSAIEAKRTGQYEFKDALAEHKEVVDEQVQYLEVQRLEEIRGRFRELPAAGELGGLVRSLSDRLWERAPDDADFLRLRAGTAELPSRTTGEGHRAAAPATCARSSRRSPAASACSTTSRCRSTSRRCRESAWPARCRRPGRWPARWSCRRSRCTARPISPSSRSSARPALAEWEFLKWLPHARSLGGAQLASTSHHALGLVNHLLQARVTDAAGGDRGGRLDRCSRPSSS